MKLLFHLTYVVICVSKFGSSFIQVIDSNDGNEIDGTLRI